MLNSQLKKQATVKESALIGVLVLALCYVAYTYLYSPKKISVVTTEEQLVKIEQDKKQKLQVVQELRNNQKKQTEEAVKLNARTTTTTEQNPMLQMNQRFKNAEFKNMSEFLNTVAKPEFRTSVEIASLKYTESKAEMGYVSTGFHLVANGQFIRIISFLEKLEGVSALVAIEAVNMSANKSNDVVILDLKGTFYQLEDDHV